MVRRQPFLQGCWRQQLVLGIVGQIGQAHQELRSLNAILILPIDTSQRCFSDGLLVFQRRLATNYL